MVPSPGPSPACMSDGIGPINRRVGQHQVSHHSPVQRTLSGVSPSRSGPSPACKIAPAPLQASYHIMVVCMVITWRPWHFKGLFFYYFCWETKNSGCCRCCVNRAHKEGGAYLVKKSALFLTYKFIITLLLMIF